MTSNIYKETVKNFYWKMAHGRFTTEQEKAIERALTICAEIDIKQLEALVEVRDNYRIPFDMFTKPTCRGAAAFGTACGQCEKCVYVRRNPPPSKLADREILEEARPLLTKILRGLKG